MTPTTTLSFLISDYIDTTGRVASEGTVAHYYALSCRISDYLGREALVADLNDRTIGKWIRWRLKRVAASTMRGEAAKLLAVWRWAARKGWAIEPELQVPRRADKVPRALDRCEIRALFRAGRSVVGDVGGVPRNLFWPAMLGVLYDTGERIGAAHALQWQDVDVRSRTIYWPAAVRKGRVQDSRKQVTRRTASALSRLRGASPVDPFGAIKTGALYYQWHVVRKAAQLDRGITPHTLRRTHATYLRLDGGDATASLGHASDATTLRHYIDPTKTQGRAPCDRLPAVSGWLARLWSG